MTDLFSTGSSISWALVCAKAEQVINSALSYAPEHENLFADVVGKSLRITSQLPPCELIIRCGPSNLLIQPLDPEQREPFESEPSANSSDEQQESAPNDAHLSGSLLALVALAASTQSIHDPEAPDSYGGPVQLSGDLAFVALLRDRLQSLDIDWEAWLATLVGDIPAHLLGKSLRKAGSWQAQTRSRSADGLENYFNNEWSARSWRETADKCSDAMIQQAETLVKVGGDRELMRERLDQLKSRFLHLLS